MFSSLRFIFFFIISLFAIFFLQSAVNYLLPYPFNQINPVYLVLTWFFIYKNKDEWLWVALGVSITMEIYSSMPFGVMTASVLSSIILARYIFQIIFTNFTWINIFLLGFLIFFISKIILFIILFILSFAERTNLGITLLDLYIWTMESVINAIVFLSVFLIAKMFAPKKMYYGSF